MKRKTIKASLLALMLILMLGTAALAETYSAIVSADSVAVYSDAALKNKVGTLKRSAVVLVTDTVKNASRIKAGSASGYIKSSALTRVTSISKSAVINQNTSIYREANTYAKSTTIKKGLAVNVLSTQGLWALIERNGSLGYLPITYLTYTDAVAPAPTTAPVKTNYSAVATATKMYVYQKPDAKSTCLGYVPKGKGFTVTAESGNWAYITLNGRSGYAKLSQMKKGSAANISTTSWRIYLKDTSISVEKRIAMYLMQEMKLNAAATSAILASVQRESSFHVDIGSYDGGYGIVQWTGSRNTRLKNWCKNHGYDYRTLIAQMRFLDYELNTYYPKILRYLKSVPNTPTGAWDAGYYFCYNFEIPANRENSSKVRGDLAKNKFYPKYS